MSNNDTFFKKQMERYNKRYNINTNSFPQNTNQSNIQQSRSYIGQLIDNLKPKNPKEEIEKLKQQDRVRAIGNALSLVGKGVAAWEGITPKPFDNSPFTRNAQQRFLLQQDFDNSNKDYNLLRLSEAKNQIAEDAASKQWAVEQDAARKDKDRDYDLKNRGYDLKEKELEYQKDEKKAQRKADAEALNKRLNNELYIADLNNKSRERIAQTRVSSGEGAGKTEDGSFVFFDTDTKQEKTLSPAIVTRLEAYMAVDDRYSDIYSLDLRDAANRAKYNDAIITLYNEKKAEFEDLPMYDKEKTEGKADTFEDWYEQYKEQPPTEKKNVRDATYMHPKQLSTHKERLEGLRNK